MQVLGLLVAGSAMFCPLEAHEEHEPGHQEDLCLSLCTLGGQHQEHDHCSDSAGHRHLFVNVYQKQLHLSAPLLLAPTKGALPPCGRERVCRIPAGNLLQDDHPVLSQLMTLRLRA